MNLRKRKEKYLLQLRKQKILQRIKVSREDLIQRRQKINKEADENSWFQFFQIYENECLCFFKNRQIEEFCDKLEEINNQISSIEDTDKNPSYLLIQTRIPSLIIYSLANLQIQQEEQCMMVQILTNICTANKKQLQKLDIFSIIIILKKLMTNCNPDFFENCIWLFSNLLIEIPELIEKFNEINLWKGIFVNYQRYLNSNKIQSVFPWFLNVISKTKNIQLVELKVFITILKQILDSTKDHQQQKECLEAIQNLLLSDSYENKVQIKLIIEIDFSQTLFDLYEQVMNTEVKKNVTFIFQIFSTYDDAYCQQLFESKGFMNMLNRMIFVKSYNILQSSLIMIQNIQKNFENQARKILDVQIAQKLVDVYKKCQFELTKKTILQIFKWFLNNKDSDFFIKLLKYNFHQIFLFDSVGNKQLMLEYQDFLCKFNQFQLYDFENDHYFNFEQYLKDNDQLEEFQNYFYFEQIYCLIKNFSSNLQVFIYLINIIHKTKVQNVIFYILGRDFERIFIIAELQQIHFLKILIFIAYYVKLIYLNYKIFWDLLSLLNFLKIKLRLQTQLNSTKAFQLR